MMIFKRAAALSITKILMAGIIIGIVAMAVAVSAYHQSGNAQFCGFCHSMKPVHHEWNLSNHHQFTCTECHLPDTHIIGKVAYKTRAGLNDLFHEAARTYPASISLSPHGREIINGNCRRCHTSTIANTPMVQQGANCLKCHRFVVHGRGPDEGGIEVEK